MTIFADKVLESTTTEGTNSYALDGAPSGFKSFVEGFGTGNTCVYYAANADGTIWELGLGTVTDATPDTLTRTTIYKSSSSDAKINWGSGTKYIYSIPSGYILSALLTTNKASTRPAWVQAGGLWIKDASEPWSLFVRDDNDDIRICNIDPTNNKIIYDSLAVESDSATADELIVVEKTSSTKYTTDDNFLLTLRNNTALNDATWMRWLTNAISIALGVPLGENNLVVRVNTTGTPVEAMTIDGTTGGVRIGGAAGGNPAGGVLNAVGFEVGGVPLFSESLGNAGYVKFANGYIEQWGNTSVAANTTVNVTLPIAYSSNNYNVVASCSTADGDRNIGAVPNGTSQITLKNNSAINQTVYWVSRGK